MENYYDVFKALHIISMTAWMVGMFYLPRIYVYHAGAKRGSEMDKTFQTMERRLMRIIMNPAMIIVLVMGVLLASIYGFKSLGVWFQIKMFLVLILLGIHGLLAKYRNNFVKGTNIKSPTFYKFVNETISVAFILIILLVVIKPFEG